MKSSIRELHQFLINHKLTLSLAESVTGGALASEITSQAGASNYFLGSIVAYSNELKRKILGVSEKILRDYGAVSAETVEEMVKGIKNITGSDISIAVSGIAGPSGGTLNTPVGTIWAAIIVKDQKPKVWKFVINGSREIIIKETVVILVNSLLDSLKTGTSHV